MNYAFFRPFVVALSVPLVVLVGVVVGDPPAPVAVSKYAPADDLIKQVDLYVASMRDGLADMAVYTDKSRLITRDAHTMAALALALAQSDENHKLKESAPALLAAARDLSKAKDYDAAKTAFTAVEAAVAGKAASAPDVKWERVAGLGQLMKQVTFVNNRLRRNISRFDARKDDNARDAAVLAVIGQAVMFDTHEVKNPDDLDKWYQLCGEMRDTAGGLNAAVHAGDKSAAEAALEKLRKNCDACHETFRVRAEP